MLTNAELTNYLEWIADYVEAGDWRSALQARQEIITKMRHITHADEVFGAAKMWAERRAAD